MITSPAWRPQQQRRLAAAAAWSGGGGSGGATPLAAALLAAVQVLATLQLVSIPQAFAVNSRHCSPWPGLAAC